MKGLLIRDVLVLRRKVPAVRIAVLAVAIVLFSFLMRFAGTGLISVILPMMATGTANILAIEDDKTNWQKFVRASPASVWDEVRSRYLVCGAILLVVGICAFLLNLACYALFREQPLYLYAIFPAVGVIAAYVNALVMIPSCFSRGADGASFVSGLLMLVVGLVAWLLTQVDVGWLASRLSEIPVPVYVVCGITTTLAATALSLFISVRACRNKTLY